MFETIEQLDQELLLTINRHNTPFLDQFFYFLSNKWAMIPLYMILLLIVLREFKNKTWLIIGVVALLILASDQFASGFLKPLVMRYRPCHNLFIGPQLHLVNGECGGQYGFISSHAANTFALATFLGLLLRLKWPKLLACLLLWAALVSYSRIYLGVHYPLDVIGGAMDGIIFGWLFYKLQVYLNDKIFVKVEIKR